MRREIEGEILAPGETVRVVGRRHVFSGERFDHYVPVGLSIAEILSRLDVPGDVSVRLNGDPIERKNFARIRLKRGVTLTVIPLAGDGNLRTVLSAVISIAAIALATFIAGPSGLALSGVTAALVQAGVAGAVMLAGTLALNALFPVRPALKDDSSSPGAFNSIQGASNQSNPFGPVPSVLGRHRQWPFLAAKTYTEISGTDQYLRLLFCLGYGPLSIDSIQIGETPIASFEGVEIETRQGLVGDTAVTLFPSSVSELALSIELDAPSDGTFTDGNNGAWYSQTSAAAADFISVDYTAVDGVFATDQTGKEVPFHLKIETQYRVASSGGAWSGTLTSFLYRSTVPTRTGLRFAVTRGQYEVRSRRATGQGDPQYSKQKIIWSALRSESNVVPVSFPKPLALIALRIKATGQLSGTISSLNCITTSLVNAYSGSGSTWNANTASQNPADLFRHVLQGPANARPKADAEIDISTLQSWWTYCNSNGFKFNQVVTQAGGSVWSKLADICAAGRAKPTFNNGLFSVVWDRPADSIVQHFTPRNSWGLKGQKVYTQQPHGWRITFINESNGFTQDERIVYDDGYSVANATLFEGLPGNLPGVTDPALVWKHGRFHIAQARLRPETLTFSAGWESLVCTDGDRVSIAHDVLLVGLSQGRVVSVVGQVVHFDETLTIDGVSNYGLVFRVPDDARTVTASVNATGAGDYTTLTLTGDLSLVVAGCLFSFGILGQETGTYRVKEIRRQSDLSAAITVVDDAPAISTADSGTIPAYTPNITIPPDPLTLPPRDFRYSQDIDGQGATARAIVHLFWQVPRFGNIASFEVQLQDNDNGGPWGTVASVVPPSTSVDVPISRAGVFSFRVRCIFTNGTASAWASLENLALDALSTAPLAVTNLHQRAVDSQTVLDWTIVDDRRLLNYEIRKGTSWDTALVVGDVVSQPPWATTGDGTYFVRAYVLSPFGTRIYSATDASITIADSVTFRNIIVEVDEQATGWTGSRDGALIVGGPFLQTDPAGSISLPWAAEVVSDLVLTGVKIAVYASSTIVNIGKAAECRFWTEFEAVGVAAGADFLGTTDILAETDILGASPTRSIRAFPVWRFALDGTADVFAPTDIFAETDIYTSGINWGPWTKVAQGMRKCRYFQAGYVVITDDATVNAAGTKFSWFVDVPDRTDDYTNLTVGSGGLALTFYPGGYDASPGAATASPFTGGPNGATVPHVQRGQVNETLGDEVNITALTLSGCTVTVTNAGTPVTRSGVNLLIRGYGYA